MVRLLLSREHLTDLMTRVLLQNLSPGGMADAPSASAVVAFVAPA
jgi:hypothetical protein